MDGIYNEQMKVIKNIISKNYFYMKWGIVSIISIKDIGAKQT